MRCRPESQPPAEQAAFGRLFYCDWPRSAAFIFAAHAPTAVLHHTATDWGIVAVFAAEDPLFDAWQTAEGLVVAGALLLIFVFTNRPLQILFMGMFVLNHTFETTGLAAQAAAWLGAQGVVLADPGPLLVASALLSNLVTTFARNLLLVGSIANLIVADLLHQQGIVIDCKRHAITGIPVTLVSLVSVLV